MYAFPLLKICLPLTFVMVLKLSFLEDMKLCVVLRQRSLSYLINFYFVPIKLSLTVLFASLEGPIVDLPI